MKTLNEAIGSLQRQIAERISEDALSPCVLSFELAQAVLDVLTAPEAKQEPVAWMYQNANTDSEYLVWKRSPGGRNWKPLYTHPAPSVNTALQERITKLEQALDVALEALEKSMYPQKLQLDAVAMLKELK